MVEGARARARLPSSLLIFSPLADALLLPESTAHLPPLDTQIAKRNEDQETEKEYVWREEL
jgi:hypothetical protein